MSTNFLQCHHLRTKSIKFLLMYKCNHHQLALLLCHTKTMLLFALFSVGIMHLPLPLSGEVSLILLVCVVVPDHSLLKPSVHVTIAAMVMIQ